MNRTLCAFLMLLALAAIPYGRADIVPFVATSHLVEDADLIVVGRITGAYIGDSSGQPTQIAVFAVDRVLKGQPQIRAGKLGFSYPATGTAQPVSSGQYGIAFLHSSSTGTLSPVESSLSLLPALPTRPLKGTTTETVMQSVVDELVNVFTSPPPELFDAVGGAWTSNGDLPQAQKAQLVYAHASQPLISLPPQVTVPILKKLAAGASTPLARLMLVTSLVQAGDESLLDTVTPLMMNPTIDTQTAVIALAHEIGNHVKTPASITFVTALVQSPITEVKLNAFSALQHIGTNAALKPLALGLADNDSTIRYYAVSGLAQITNAQPAPSMPLFEEHETEYLQFWQRWAAQNQLTTP